MTADPANTPPPGPGPVDDSPVRPGLARPLLALLALCAFWALTAPFIGESNGGVVLVLFSLLVAWPVVSWLVIARWGGRGLLRLAFGVAVVPATPVALLLLWDLEVDGLGWLLHRRPPPRPVFCNDFVDDERTLLPYWYPPSPVTDRLGHWAWADNRDNLLLVVVLGVPETARVNDLRSGKFEYTVKVGPDRQERYLTLKRTTDALVVVLPDGSHGQFALRPGMAKQFYEARRSRVVKNVLREAGDLLEPGEKAGFDKFLAGYRESGPR